MTVDGFELVVAVEEALDGVVPADELEDPAPALGTELDKPVNQTDHKLIPPPVLVLAKYHVRFQY